ncbi:MAG: phosphoribosylformylglycinamidine cyclo-ligase [Dehalococcoidia bacterium]
MPGDLYRTAGVDRDLAEEIKARIQGHAQRTYGPQVLGGVGPFAGLYRLEGYREPVLVASTDGVGTKLKVAARLGRYESLGVDLVNASVNDILTCGARPLFFLDYIAAGRLSSEHTEALVKGMARACQAAGCALLGGETAQMPGVYLDEAFDLVGFVVGVVERHALLDGSTIAEGDVLLGVPSSGLHTNGYSLVRKVFGLDQEPSVLHRTYPELDRTLGEELLEPHRAYYPLLEPVLPLLKGMAHITGGGLVENVPRVLPSGLAAQIDRSAWEVPPIFRLVQQAGDVNEQEMLRVFNMGIGMVLVCAPEQVSAVQARVPEAQVIGRVVRQEGERVQFLE